MKLDWEETHYCYDMNKQMCVKVQNMHHFLSSPNVKKKIKASISPRNMALNVANFWAVFYNTAGRLSLR